MGTNYYWHPSGERECPHCKQPTPSLHIGKSSGGWCFSLRIHPDEGIHDLPDWVSRWASGAISNEYDEPVPVAEMLAIITERSWKGKQPWSDEELARNGATRGPNGLARHGYRARPGAGTYDLCEGEFS